MRNYTRKQFLNMLAAGAGALALPLPSLSKPVSPARRSLERDCINRLWDNARRMAAPSSVFSFSQRADLFPLFSPRDSGRIYAPVFRSSSDDPEFAEALIRWQMGMWSLYGYPKVGSEPAFRGVADLRETDDPLTEPMPQLVITRNRRWTDSAGTHRVLRAGFVSYDERMGAFARFSDPYESIMV